MCLENFWYKRRDGFPWLYYGSYKIKMSKINKLIIAAAGAGKSYLFNPWRIEARWRGIITTYTEANESEIKKKFIEINGAIPKNMTLQTWFWIYNIRCKPYQNYLTNKKINGMIFINQQSSQYISEINVDKHYFSKEYKIYSDKLSKFVSNAMKKVKV